MNSKSEQTYEAVAKERTGLSDILRRFFDSDLWFSFRHSPVAIVSMAVSILIVFSAVFAHWIAPTNPFDLAQIDLLDSEIPPVWMADGDSRFILGTDDQGRDIFSTILYGSRVSLLVGFASVVFAMAIGIPLGLISGYYGGYVDAVIMRIADVQLSFPAILIAFLIDGVARGILPRDVHDEMALYVLVFAIGISGWVQYARTVRGSTMVEKNKEYVLPNVLGPVLVIATIHLALAIITEATLSFLGVGVPVTSPSLGTLIRVGYDFLFSGVWWITIMPGVALIILVLAINLVGDWLRDALNPKLR